jgi:hypothetical protein
MKNRIFQFLWYRIVRHFVRTGDGLEGQHRRFIAMMKLAKMLGGADGVLLGDSEIGQFDSYAVMKKFSRLVMNWGQGGTVAGEWVKYFNGKGKLLYQDIRNLKKVVSIGGNYSLRSMMFKALGEMRLFHDMLSGSYILIVPPVYITALALLSKTVEQWNIEMHEIRKYQHDLWGRFAIDTYTPFLSKSGDPLPGVLEDMVHFSKRCVMIIEKYLNWLKIV